MVLLDFGLAEELTPRVRRHFISFLHAIVAGDGAAGARHLLAFGEIQKCHQPAAFQADMIDLFRRECDICAPKGINVDVVRARLCVLACQAHIHACTLHPMQWLLQMTWCRLSLQFPCNCSPCCYFESRFLPRPLMSQYLRQAGWLRS